MNILSLFDGIGTGRLALERPLNSKLQICMEETLSFMKEVGMFKNKEKVND